MTNIYYYIAKTEIPGMKISQCGTTESLISFLKKETDLPVIEVRKNYSSVTFQCKDRQAIDIRYVTAYPINVLVEAPEVKEAIHP